jgi:predicted transcriptional regulator
LAVKIRDVAETLDAEVLAGEDGLDRDIGVVISSDLVSDILCCRDVGAFLITGLAKIQILRAADMIDLVGICFVRGKVPEPEVITYAREMDLPVILTPRTMYETCGLVYQLGAKSGVYSPPSGPE